MTFDRNRARGNPPPPANPDRVGIVEGWEIRRSRRRVPRGGAFKGIVFVVLAVVVLGVGGWLLARPMLGSAVTGIFQDNPGIIRFPVVADLLAAELADRIARPASAEPQDVRLTIDEGESIDEIRDELLELGLLTDPVAFHYLVVNDRVDQLIVAGTYTLNTGMSPGEIVERLAGSPDPPAKVVTLAIRDGLRIDQVASLLQKMKDEDGLELDVRDFLALANDPPDRLREDYPFLKAIPQSGGLEGFLKGGTWEVRLDMTAEELVAQMLTNWDEEYGDVVSQSRKKGLDFYDVLRVASIVERETPRDGERARVAGVYWNRLDDRTAGETAGFMNADPDRHLWRGHARAGGDAAGAMAEARLLGCAPARTRRHDPSAAPGLIPDVPEQGPAGLAHRHAFASVARCGPRP